MACSHFSISRSFTRAIYLATVARWNDPNSIDNMCILRNNTWKAGKSFKAFENIFSRNEMKKW